MKEHPIIFSSEMVKAILCGHKTQTRRVIKKHSIPLGVEDCLTLCPYGQVGDRLWCRETWYSSPDKKEMYGYVADKDIPHGKAYRILPSIHMPRWASRITLEITEIRVERIREISITDIIAEGFYPHPGWPNQMFDKYWDSINAQRGYSWESNPWVWVINFKKV